MLISGGTIRGGTIYDLTDLYPFTTFTFTSNIVGPSGPTLGNLYNTYSNAGNTWLTNTGYFYVPNNWQGYQIWTVPHTGPYRITAAGSRSGLISVYSGNITYGNAHGRGAIVQGVFNLQRGQKITILAGQPSGNTFQVSTYSTPGGGGGSFVVLGNIASDTFANLTPLIIGGGGGAPGAWTSNTALLPGGYGVTTKRGGNSAGNIGAGTTSLRFGAPGGVNGSGGNTHVNVSGTVGTNGYDSGGGGGFSGNGITYNGSGWSNVRLAPQSTFGGGGMSFLANAIGGTYSTTYPPLGTSFGGFGGGGGAGPIVGGGGGGYSGGGGGYGGSSTQLDSGGGGGSYIDGNATSVATSDGQFDLSGTFNGASITNLGTYNNAAGYISIVKL
jgi:hypothetical protein